MAQSELAAAGQSTSETYTTLRNLAQEVRDTLRDSEQRQAKQAEDAERQATATKNAADYAEFIKERQEASAAAYRRARENAERLAEVEAQRQMRSLAAIAVEDRRLQQASELLGLTGRDLLLKQQSHRVDDLRLRIQNAITAGRREEAAALGLLLADQIRFNEAQLAAFDAQEASRRSSDEQTDALKEQRDIYADIHGIIGDINSDFARMLNAIVSIIRVWRQFSQPQAQGVVGDLLSLGRAGGLTRGFGAPAMPAPASGSVVIQNTTNLPVADISGNVMQAFVEGADVINAAQTDYALRTINRGAF